MKCSQCQHADTKVIESRDVTDGEAIRRRRACEHCQYRFTTYERIERPQIIVVKNNFKNKQNSILKFDIFLKTSF